MCVRQRSYQSLDHLHALFSEMFDTLADTEGALCLHLLHHHVQSDEGAGATNTCTAVDQQWPVLGGWEHFTDVTDEPDDRHDIVGDSVIWPGSVVELSHFHRFIIHQLLCGRKTTKPT